MGRTRRRPPAPRCAAALWLVLAAVLLALPVYGGSAVALKLLGPAHRHLQAGTAHAAQHPLDDDDEAHGHRHAQAQAHVHPLHASAHPHDALERHHHAPGDTSVVKDDDQAAAQAAGAADEAGAGSATLPLALGFLLRLPTAPSRRRRWPRAGHTAWRNGRRCRLERPPPGR